MAYVRTLDPPLSRRRRRRCSSCSRHVCDFERHCPFCGRVNPSFDANLHVAIAGCTLEEAQRACRMAAVHALERRANVGGRARYCPECGGVL